MSIFRFPIFVVLMISMLLLSAGCTDSGCSRNIKDESTLTKVETFKGFMSANNIYKIGLVEDGVYVLNELVISTNDKIYADIPAESFISDYKSFLLSNSKSNWSQMESKLPSNLSLDSLEEHVKGMNSVGITSAYTNSSDSLHVFQSGSSVMRGFCGLMIGAQNDAEQYSKEQGFSFTEEIASKVFYFEYR